MTAPSPNRNITRMDYERNHGYWVRFQRGTGLTSASFSDAAYGGKRKALAAARAWRDRVLRQRLVLPAQSSRERVPAGHGYLRKKDVRQRVGVYPQWIAWVRLADGRNATTRYSIEKHGDRKAKRLAEAWLRKKRAEMR